MATYNICFSPTGGTKKVADIIANALADNTIDIDLCKHIAHLSLTKDDVCLISVPSYGGRVPETAVERLNKISANGAKAILICVYGNREWEDTLSELQDTVTAIGFKCYGAIAAVAEHSIFRRFAAGRPDVQDAEELHNFASQIKPLLDSEPQPELNLPGNHGQYKEFGGTPLKPEANSDCSECGLCAEECPAGAIPVESPRSTDPTKCISCMRCINICPNSARNLNPDLFLKFENIIGPKLSGRKGNFLFIEFQQHKYSKRQY